MHTKSLFTHFRYIFIVLKMIRITDILTYKLHAQMYQPNEKDYRVHRGGLSCTYFRKRGFIAIIVTEKMITKIVVFII